MGKGGGGLLWERGVSRKGGEKRKKAAEGSRLSSPTRSEKKFAAWERNQGNSGKKRGGRTEYGGVHSWAVKKGRTERGRGKKEAKKSKN